MVGRVVVMFLKSPLFPFRWEVEGQPVQLPKDIVQLRGEVIKEKGAGLLVRVVAMGSDDLTRTSNLPLSEVFIPYAKVDYLLVE